MSHFSKAAIEVHEVSRLVSRVWNTLESMLECPRCEDGLLPTRNQIAMNLFCPSCTGRAVAKTSFGRGIRRNLAAHLEEWVEAGDDTADSCKCPACKKPMSAFAQQVSGGTVAVDACRPCGIFWCDRDGLEQLSPNLNQLNEALTLGAPVTKATMVSKSPPVAMLLFASLCVGVSILYFRNPTLISELGFVPARPLNQLGLTLISGLFLHVSFGHLLGNLYFLSRFGGDVEDVIGTDDALLLFLYSGIVAGIMAGVYATNPNITAVGSSAGISAFLCFYALAYPRARISALRPGWFPASWNRVRILNGISFPLTVWTFVWLAEQTLAALAQGPLAAVTSNSLIGHLTGAAVGAAYYFLRGR